MDIGILSFFRFLKFVGQATFGDRPSFLLFKRFYDSFFSFSPIRGCEWSRNQLFFSRPHRDAVDFRPDFELVLHRAEAFSSQPLPHLLLSHRRSFLIYRLYDFRTEIIQQTYGSEY